MIEHINFHQVEAESAKLRTMTRDPERFHAMEDDLYLRVLQSIADGVADDPAALAAEVLKNGDILAQRWYA